MPPFLTGTRPRASGYRHRIKRRRHAGRTSATRSLRRFAGARQCVTSRIVSARPRLIAAQPRGAQSGIPRRPIAAALKSASPAFHAPLCLPQLGPDVPRLLSSGPGGAGLAFIADGFYRAGLLLDSDWNGDLITSLNSAILRWVHHDCRASRLELLSIGRLVYSDDPFCASAQMAVFTGGLTLDSRPEVWESKAGWTRGGLVLLNSFHNTRYAFGAPCTRLNAVQTGLGFIVFQLLCVILDNYGSAITPQTAYQQSYEWDMSVDDEGQEADGYSPLKIKKENPPEVWQSHLQPRHRKLLQKIAGVPLDRSFTDDHLFAHEIAGDALELWDLWRALDDLPREDDVHCSVDASPAPSIVLTWHPGPEDSIARFADDWLQMTMEGESSNLIAIDSFWVPRTHSEEASASLVRAIHVMGARLKMLAACEELVSKLESNDPIPVARRGRKPKNKTLLELLGVPEGDEAERADIDRLALFVSDF